MRKLNIAVLASGSGTILPTILEKFEIKLIVSNKTEAPIFKKAEKHQIPAIYETDEQKISNIMQEHNIDLILLIGYMRILSEKFVRTWQNKIINVHPSLLPNFAGLIDLKVHKAVIESGAKQTGCTVHFVDVVVDAGPIIIQKSCEVKPDDTPEKLKARVQALEGPAMIEAITKFDEKRKENE